MGAISLAMPGLRVTIFCKTSVCLMASVNATLAMAHSMDLEVVAEGVTSYAQLEFLQGQVR